MSDIIREHPRPEVFVALTTCAALLLMVCGYVLFIEHPKQYGRWDETVVAHAVRISFNAPNKHNHDSTEWANFEFIAPDGRAYTVRVAGADARRSRAEVRFSPRYPEGAFIDPMPSLRVEWLVLVGLFTTLTVVLLLLTYRLFNSFKIEKILRFNGIPLEGEINEIDSHSSSSKGSGSSRARRKYSLMLTVKQTDGTLVRILSGKSGRYGWFKVGDRVRVLRHPTKNTIFRISTDPPRQRSGIA
jgi:hypothetical protein